jgi:two-component system, cell cycle response regulator
MSSLDKTTRLDNRHGLLASANQGKSFKMLFAIIQGTDIDFGRSYQFMQDIVVIGRSEECDIRLSDDKISRRHCQIELVRNGEEEHVELHDQHSTNGTMVNGEAINSRMLLSGDRIEIGSTILRFSYSDQIEEQFHTRLFDMATTDELTGVYNKRYLLRELENQSRIAKRNQRVFSLIMFDIDHFKTVNDTYGHLAGDEFLRLVAFSVGRLLREQDIIGRFGGEEFMVILPETPLEGAMTLAERIRGRIADAELLYSDRRIRATISVGVAEFGRHGNDLQILMQAVDKAMYRAKNNGRNRVFAASRE